MFSNIFLGIIYFIIAVPLVFILIGVFIKICQAIIFLVQVFTEAVAETGKEYTKHYLASNPAVKVYTIIMLGVVLLGFLNILFR